MFSRFLNFRVFYPEKELSIFWSFVFIFGNLFSSCSPFKAIFSLTCRSVDWVLARSSILGIASRPASCTQHCTTLLPGPGETLPPFCQKICAIWRKNSAINFWVKTRFFVFKKLFSLLLLSKIAEFSAFWQQCCTNVLAININKGIVMVRVRVQKLEIPQSLRLDVQIRNEAVAHTGCRTGHSRILS